jgi:hypothetical protein
MADHIFEGGETKNDQTGILSSRDPNIISVARRRVMKAGLASVPVVLTLKGRSLFGQSTTPSIAASIAAGTSLHKT